ncbi:NAD-dependent protein deacylase, partial [bacterium]|nr:NAD-dependent protein deacylase [bacterium]
MNINKIIKESNYIVFFGGAGVSTASGIPDFRSVDGIYNERYEYPPERILSHSFYLSNPEYFYKFYKDKFNLLDKKPNIIHEKLVELEKANKLKCIITQNIDGLHQKAGSKNVLELHGSIYRNYCERCHKFYDEKKVFESDGIPKCSCGGIIKPDVVLYEEALSDTFLEAIDKIRESDTLIVAGTSLVVYPASSLIEYFHGKNLILINKEKTPYD